jgi:hypothetical protein
VGWGKGRKRKRKQTHIAAYVSLNLDSQKKNATIKTNEITSGAITCAEPHPSIEPDVIANINNIAATVNMNTPPRSNLLNRNIRSALDSGRAVRWRRGTRRIVEAVMTAETMEEK